MRLKCVYSLKKSEEESHINYQMIMLIFCDKIVHPDKLS